MAISDYSTTRDSNATIAPGDLRSNDARRDQQIINAIRQLMADLAAMAAGGVNGVEKITIVRNGSETTQYFELGLSEAAGHLITGFSATNNAKGFIFDATTDTSDTAPSAGENSYSFQIRSVEKFRIDDSSNTTFSRQTFEVQSAAGQRLVQIPLDSNGALELGKVDGNTSTPLIDFHTSATPTDYNVRIIASGTSSVNGSGQLDLHADGGLNLINGRVNFPAAQNPSTEANVLDDYEEGTFTPVLEFGGASVGMTYSTQVGKYVKVGQLAFVQGRIILTAKGSSTGQARINGLPFTSNSNHNYTPIRIGYWQALTTVTGQPGAYIETSNTYANIGQSGGGGFAGLTEANFQNTSDIIFAGCYRTSA